MTIHKNKWAIIVKTVWARDIYIYIGLSRMQSSGISRAQYWCWSPSWISSTSVVYPAALISEESTVPARAQRFYRQHILYL